MFAIVNAEFVVIFMICLCTKFHVPVCNDPLVTVMKLLDADFARVMLF